MMQSERRRKRTGAGRRVRRAAVIMLAVLLLLWTGGFVLTHTGQDVAVAVHNVHPELELKRTENLYDRIGSSGGFPWYEAYKGNQYVGDVFLFTFRNTAFQRPFLLPLMVPREITWAVYVDSTQTVQSVWSVSPRYPLGLDPRYSLLLDSLKGIACRDLISTRMQTSLTGDGGLTASMRLALSNLAVSVVASRTSSVDLDRLIREERTAGLVNHERFPLFNAVTTAGRRIDTAALKGHNTLFMTAEPACGSCVDAVVQSIKKVRALRGDAWNIVLVVFADIDGAGSQALMAQAGSSVDVVLDPDRVLGSQISMPDSPYMALLDNTVTVLYKGGGDDLPKLFAAIDTVQAGGTLP